MIDSLSETPQCSISAIYVPTITTKRIMINMTNIIHLKTEQMLPKKRKDNKMMTITTDTIQQRHSKDFGILLYPDSESIQNVK